MNLYDLAIAKKLAGGGGGGGGGVSPIYEETVAIQAGTTAIKVKELTFDDVMNKNIYVVTADVSGLRDDRLYSTTISGFFYSMGFERAAQQTVKGQNGGAISSTSNNIGIYGTFSKSGTSLVVKLWAKSSSDTGTIDSTYKIQIFAF